MARLERGNRGVAGWLYIAQSAEFMFRMEETGLKSVDNHEEQALRAA